MIAIEQQIVQGVMGLLSLAITAGIAYVTPHVKTFINAHTTAHTAAIANSVIDGLSSIAESVVTDFNQTVVADAKANGTFDATFAAKVKADAVAAVKAQGASLITLGESVVGNMDSLVSSLIEQAVVGAKPTVVGVSNPVATPVPIQSVPPTSEASK